MHELSIAQSVVEVATRHAAGRPVRVVELRVGHLRQVVPASLEFAWELLTEGSPLDGARLEIEVVPARVACRDCEAESVIDGFPLACGRCGALDVEVVAGEELLVSELELEEELAMIGDER
ncbi:MAG: hydrogenase maturation nickel metallochaperone HypA [Solirubrobacterales bacterium]|nr:hydrogenase maturation nickel metallochaperone HypA [Solirubrobacterales bacterium]